MTYEEPEPKEPIAKKFDRIIESGPHRGLKHRGAGTYRVSTRGFADLLAYCETLEGKYDRALSVLAIYSEEAKTLRLIDADLDLLREEWVRFRHVAVKPEGEYSRTEFNQAGSEMDIVVARLVSRISLILKGAPEG